MNKLTPEESMFKIAEIISNAVKIPDHCTLDRDDIYQQVCLIYLESYNGKTPGYLRDRMTNAIMNYIKEYSLQIACGLLMEVAEYRAGTALERDILLETVSKIVSDTLETLTPREQDVIERHFGVSGKDQETFRDISETYHICHGRIGQIEAKALHKLRHPSRSRKLRDAYDMLQNGMID